MLTTLAKQKFSEAEMKLTKMLHAYNEIHDFLP